MLLSVIPAELIALLLKGLMDTHEDQRRHLQQKKDHECVTEEFKHFIYHCHLPHPYRQRFPAACSVYFSVKEVILIPVREIILRAHLAAKVLAILDLLKIVQTAGDTLVAIAVEGIEVDTCPAIHSEIHF